MWLVTRPRSCIGFDFSNLLFYRCMLLQSSILQDWGELLTVRFMLVNLSTWYQWCNQLGAWSGRRSGSSHVLSPGLNHRYHFIGLLKIFEKINVNSLSLFHCLISTIILIALRKSKYFSFNFARNALTVTFILVKVFIAFGPIHTSLPQNFGKENVA